MSKIKITKIIFSYIFFGKIICLNLCLAQINPGNLKPLAVPPSTPLSGVRVIDDSSHANHTNMASPASATARLENSLPVGEVSPVSMVSPSSVLSPMSLASPTPRGDGSVESIEMEAMDRIYSDVGMYLHNSLNDLQIPLESEIRALEKRLKNGEQVQEKGQGQGEDKGQNQNQKGPSLKQLDSVQALLKEKQKKLQKIIEARNQLLIPRKIYEQKTNYVQRMQAKSSKAEMDLKGYQQFMSEAGADGELLHKKWKRDLSGIVKMIDEQINEINTLNSKYDCEGQEAAPKNYGQDYLKLVLNGIEKGTGILRNEGTGNFSVIDMAREIQDFGHDLLKDSEISMSIDLSGLNIPIDSKAYPAVAESGVFADLKYNYFIGNKVLIKQMIQTLIKNSIEALGEKKGEIKLKFVYSPPHLFKAIVEDTAGGIQDPKLKAGLFAVKEIKTRNDNDTTDIGKGGFGLPWIHKTAHDLKGKISYEDRLEGDEATTKSAAAKVIGSRFVLSLPMAISSSSRLPGIEKDILENLQNYYFESQKSNTPAPTKKVNILIEDSAVLRRMFKMGLEKNRKEKNLQPPYTLTFEDSDQAMQFINKYPKLVNTVFTDFHLVNTKGTDLIKILKMRAEFKNLPIFLATGSSDQDLGAVPIDVQVIKKPYDKTKIIELSAERQNFDGK